MRDISLIILHCSANDNPLYTARDIDLDHRRRGFSQIGYHYYIRKSGLLEPGRPIAEVGAHCEGHNAHSIGICVAGLAHFTPEGFKTLRDLIAALLEKYPSIKDIQPHHQFNPGKECPVYDVRPYQEMLNDRMTE